MRNAQRYFFNNHPDKVRYNIALLPEAPKEYHAVLNPEDHTIEIKEVIKDAPMAPTIAAAEVKKRHWIRTFNASLQFSQAYVSPNWYQGGNNNLNMLANIYYNVKLNPEYHPKLLFETTAQYKLGMNSAPDDSIHNYSISEDLFQVNSTFGLKAAKRWYYSLTCQFKTQLLNSYPSNSRELRASFLSPAELTVGLGMTYNYANTKKTVTFDASIAPLSYNMRICRDRRIDPAIYNIDNGRRVQNNFGSSAELKLHLTPVRFHRLRQRPGRLGEQARLRNKPLPYHSDLRAHPLRLKHASLRQREVEEASGERNTLDRLRL